MEKSFFFNAKKTGETYDRVYQAKDFASYFAEFIGNGVFPNPSTGLQVVESASHDMTTILKPGAAFINGYGYKNTGDIVFTHKVADGSLNRKDAIFIRFDNAGRAIGAIKMEGSVGAEAVAPKPTRTADYYDLCVAIVNVNAGITGITQALIEDTRMNTDVCGIVHAVVDHIDTQTLYEQIQSDLERFRNVSQAEFDAWFKDINAKLGEEPATALQQQIDEINTSIEENSDRMFSTYQHVKNRTTHNFIGTGSNGKVKMTANVADGDTVTLNGQPVPAYMGTEDFGAALDEEPVSGKWLTFTQDGTQINFKGGGGLGLSKLAAATATAAHVLSGKTFYAGDKTLKTGTMPNQGAKTAALNAGGSYTIPQGWHNGKGKVTANSLASQTSANAENGDIISGKTAWVNGSKRTGTLQDLGWRPKGTGCTLYNDDVYIYFGGQSGRYALSDSVWYPQRDIKNILSFGGSGSGNKNGGETDIHRDENNIVAKGYTVSSASASISGKTVTVNVHAHFRLNNNGNANVPNGDLSSVDYSFSFNIN